MNLIKNIISIKKPYRQLVLRDKNHLKNIKNLYFEELNDYLVFNVCNADKLKDFNVKVEDGVQNFKIDRNSYHVAFGSKIWDTLPLDKKIVLCYWLKQDSFNNPDLLKNNHTYKLGAPELTLINKIKRFGNAPQYFYEFNQLYLPESTFSYCGLDAYNSVLHEVHHASELPFDIERQRMLYRDLIGKSSGKKPISVVVKDIMLSDLSDKIDEAKEKNSTKLYRDIWETLRVKCNYFYANIKDAKFPIRDIKGFERNFLIGVYCALPREVSAIMYAHAETLEAFNEIKSSEVGVNRKDEKYIREDLVTGLKENLSVLNCLMPNKDSYERLKMIDLTIRQFYVNDEDFKDAYEKSKVNAQYNDKLSEMYNNFIQSCNSKNEFADSVDLDICRVEEISNETNKTVYNTDENDSVSENCNGKMSNDGKTEVVQYASKTIFEIDRDIDASIVYVEKI